MQLYKKLVLPQFDTIVSKLKSVVPIQSFRPAYDLDYSVSSELVKWFALNDLIVERAWVIIVDSLHTTHMHTDFGPNYPFRLALNFPLYNCSTSVTEFWHTSQDTASEIISVREEPGTSGFTRFIPNGSEQLIDQFVLDSAVLLNIQVPHRVRNFSRDIRVCASFRFQQDPKRLLES